jgi:hypothetical protein
VTVIHVDGDAVVVDRFVFPANAGIGELGRGQSAE